MYEVSYFDNLDHQFIKMKQDNASMAKENATKDTGVKISVFLVINKDNKADKEYGSITVKPMDYSGAIDMEAKTFNLRNNSMIIIKSRCVSYEIKANN